MIKLRIGYIPLCDAAMLLIAIDKGFCTAEGLEVEAVREVSWSNVRDKLNIGLFDAAHLLAPVAIASSLGLGHVKVPIIAPITMGLNGNAITVSPALHQALLAEAGSDLTTPLKSAQALARIATKRKAQGQEPLTFGMTFPYSTHHYDLRFWMAAGGLDPDEDVRLVVLPPPYMVDSLTNKQVDGFCVGAPWNSVAVNLGAGHILHFGSEIVARMTEKVLAVRQSWADENSEVLAKLVRALNRAADVVEDVNQRNDVCALLAMPNRLGVPADVIRRTLDGRLIVSPQGAQRANDHYLIVGRDGAARPDPTHAAWFYAQMVRWGQAPLSPDLLASAKAVLRPDMYDALVGAPRAPASELPPDRIGAFTGPAFDANDLKNYLSAWPHHRA